jgi:signal transduction histidine kinase
MPEKAAMVTIYFFYGLAFFTLGVSLFVRDVPEGIRELRTGLRWLALFALVHSANEWLVMAKLAGMIGADEYSDYAIALVGGASFAALLAAGLFLTQSLGIWNRRAAMLIPVATTIIWLAFLLVNVESRWHLVAGDIATRWLMGAPGAFLAAIGLFLQSRALIRAGEEKLDNVPSFKISLKPLRFGLLIAAASLAAYGLLTIPGSTGNFPPADVLNADMFKQIFGFPIQVLRGLAAVLMAAAIVFSLSQFHKIERMDMERQVQDRTRRLLINEEKLLQAVSQVNQANRAKSEFLAAMSHELRTPLNAVIGFSELIENQTFGPVGNDKYREYAADIRGAGEHLLDLINDILDLAKIEAGNEELHEEEIDIEELLRSVLVLLRERAARQKVRLTPDIQEYLPLIRADLRKLKQILLNLLTNAVKFSNPDGEVTVKVCVSTDGFLVQVIDTGIGIAAEDIPKALSQFGQVDKDASHNQEGTGLGLPLTKALVELHGGSLDLQSRLKVGTTVSVRFPSERTIVSPLPLRAQN